MKEPVTSNRILLKPAVRERLGGLSETTLWRMTRRGDFPPSIKVSAGLIGWLESDVEAWIQERRRA